jgi:hypothetical protein
VDLMLIVATTVAFVAVAAANHPAARARNRIALTAPVVSGQVERIQPMRIFRARRRRQMIDSYGGYAHSVEAPFHRPDNPWRRLSRRRPSRIKRDLATPTPLEGW